MNIEEDIIEFVSKAGRISRAEMDGGTEIYNSGLVSSLAILELMSHIERQYGVVIRPEQLIEENFRDIATIAGFVQGLVDGTERP